MQAPIIFLSFANHPDKHLPMLEKEVEQIENALQTYHDNRFIQVYKTESLSIDKLAHQADRFEGKIELFHYGGHANSQKLILRGGKGNIHGVVKLLIPDAKKAPKIVFLNGCSTKAQVQYFLDNGVQAVIATAVPIEDTKAVEFSTIFYKALGKGQTLESAFTKGIAYLQAKYDGFKEENNLFYR